MKFEELPPERQRLWRAVGAIQAEVAKRQAFSVPMDAATDEQLLADLRQATNAIKPGPSRSEIEEQARRFRPIDPTLNSSHTIPGKPRDSSLDKWGKRRGAMATWVDTNCLRACIATALQCDIEAVPDPTPFFSEYGDSWRAAFNEHLKSKCGIRLEEIPAGGCPPIDRRNWIGCIDAGEVNHAVLVNGRGLIYHDPNGHELNGLPISSQRLYFGLRVVPANAPETDNWGRRLR